MQGRAGLLHAVLGMGDNSEGGKARRGRTYSDSERPFWFYLRVLASSLLEKRRRASPGLVPFGNSMEMRPGGAPRKYTAFQRRDWGRLNSSPEGTAECKPV